MYNEKEYREYLQFNKRLSENSLLAYIRDLKGFVQFLEKRGTNKVENSSETDFIAYVQELKVEGKSASTIRRKVASLRAYFEYLKKKGLVKANPAEGIKIPRTKPQQVEYLSIDEMNIVLELPDETLKGRRDSAILELLYATGMKVTELIEANIEDVNLRMGFMTCAASSPKARIVPLGRPAIRALDMYINEVRANKDLRDERALFVNFNGERITRQGLWKIIGKYGDMAELPVNLTPNTIRNSFAIHMLQNGVSLKVLQDLMGYEDIAAVQIFLSTTQSRIKEEYDHAHPRAQK